MNNLTTDVKEECIQQEPNLNTNHSNFPVVVKKNKRGRPVKVLNFTDTELWDELLQKITDKVAKICDNDKYENRADTLRVRLIRLAKKIPLYMLHILHSKSKYKSNNKVLYREAFLNTYKRFMILLDKHGIEESKDLSSFEGANANPDNF